LKRHTHIRVVIVPCVRNKEELTELLVTCSTAKVERLTFPRTEDWATIIKIIFTPLHHFSVLTTPNQLIIVIQRAVNIHVVKHCPSHAAVAVHKCLIANRHIQVVLIKDGRSIKDFIVRYVDWVFKNVQLLTNDS